MWVVHVCYRTCQYTMYWLSVNFSLYHMFPGWNWQWNARDENIVRIYNVQKLRVSDFCFFVSKCGIHTLYHRYARAKITSGYKNCAAHQLARAYSLHVVMFRLSPIIDCRSIIVKNSDYRFKISKIDHRNLFMYEMRNVENRMHYVRIGYYLQYGGTHKLE